MVGAAAATGDKADLAAWRAVSFTPACRLYALGVILLLSLAISARNFSSLGAPAFLIPLMIAGVAYLLAIREFFSTAKFPTHVVVIGLVFAATWQLLFLRMAPGFDDDVHRYVWDGRMQRLGYNPYRVVPGDPAFAGLHTPETRTLNHPDLPSPYPPGAELFFRAVTAIHESAFAFKVAFMLADWAIVLLLLNILRRNQIGVHWVLAYAWHPLLATEAAGSGHIDILGAGLLLASFAALERRWRTVAAVTFALAVSVKFLPIVLLPLYWKRIRVRDAALAALIFGLLYIPFLSHGHIPFGSLGTYVQSFRFNDPIFAMFERRMAPKLAAGLAVFAGLLTAMWMTRKSASRQPLDASRTHGTQGALSADAFAWPMAASLLCAPVVYPWYLLWLVPFMRSSSTLPIMIWTIGILPVYCVWHLRAVGLPWILPEWVMPLEYGPVAVAAIIVELRRIRRVR